MTFKYLIVCETAKVARVRVAKESILIVLNFICLVTKIVSENDTSNSVKKIETP